MMVERLTVELGLSENQRQKIQPILIMGMEQRRLIRVDAGLSVEERYRRMKINRAAVAKKIRTYLTPAQKTKFEVVEKEGAERMRNWMLGNSQMGGSPPMRREGRPPFTPSRPPIQATPGHPNPARRAG